MIPDPANTKKTCPRCESTNTKFCYFNNYSRAQPRHFCRGCSRYWTDGGTLRNVPAGGVRKNKRRKIAGDRNSLPDSMKSPVAAGSSCSDSSQYGFGCRDVVGGFEDGVFGMVNVSMENCWVNQEDVVQTSCSGFWNDGDDFADAAALPESYWSFWDGVGDLAGDGDGEDELRG